jgi:hypothetical protein
VAGEIFREAWTLYRSHWKHFVPIALVIFVILSIATILLVAALGLIGAAFAAVLSFVGVFWLQGAIVTAVEDVRDGRPDMSIGETLNKVGPRVGTLVAAGLLAGLGVAIGLVLLIVPGLILLTWWSLIVPVIMVEGSGVMAAFGRSRELVRGHGWQVFGVIALSILIVIVAGIIVSILLAFLPEEIRSFLQSLISNTLITPFIAAAWTLMYFRLRGTETAAVEPEPATTF